MLNVNQRTLWFCTISHYFSAYSMSWLKKSSVKDISAVSELVACSKSHPESFCPQHCSHLWDVSWLLICSEKLPITTICLWRLRISLKFSKLEKVLKVFQSNLKMLNNGLINVNNRISKLESAMNFNEEAVLVKIN